MPRSLMGNSDLIRDLMKALGIPANAKWFELRAEVGEPVTVRCEHLVADPTREINVSALDSTARMLAFEKFKVEVQEYRLVPTKDAEGGD